MVANGYKKTEIGVIPEEWEVKSLSEIGSFSKGKGISKNEIVKSGIPCMRYAEIYTEYNIILKNIKSFINEKSALNSKKIINGDILFASSGETLDDIGKSVAFIDNFEVYVGGDTVILSPTIKYNSLFISFQLNSASVRTQLRKLGQGSSIVHIYSSGLEKVKIPLPPLKEQEKIADILSTADEKIDIIALQIAKTEELKKGLLQKLLSEGIGHTEFKNSELGKIPKNWEVKQIKDFSIIVTGNTPPTKDIKNYGTEYPWITPTDIGSKKNIFIGGRSLSSQGYSKARQLPKNTILITSIASIGKNAILKKQGSCNQQINAILPSDNHISEYVYYWFENNISKIIGLAGQTAVLMINKTDFSKIKIPLPPLKEQKQIADILSTVDEKLEVLRAKKEKYEKLKIALSQKLLSGKIRTLKTL